MSHPIKILIMGLPGSGKTTLAHCVVAELLKRSRTVDWFNADKVRQLNDDWDFSIEGRMRQANRMRDMADKSTAEFCVIDFIAPLATMRDVIDADCSIWLDTIEKGRYEDTNALFERPTEVDLYIANQDAEKWAQVIVTNLFAYCEKE